MSVEKIFLEVDMSCDAEVQLSNFALKAKTNAQYVYGSSQKGLNSKIQMLAYAFYTQGLLHLVQKRVDDEFQYIAVKRKVVKRQKIKLGKNRKKS